MRRGPTHGCISCIHLRINGSEGGQLCRAAGQAAVQLIIAGHLIVCALQVLLILYQQCFVGQMPNKNMTAQSLLFAARHELKEHLVS